MGNVSDRFAATWMIAHGFQGTASLVEKEWQGEEFKYEEAPGDSPPGAQAGLGVLGVVCAVSIVYTVLAVRVYQTTTTVCINTSFTDTLAPLPLDQICTSGPPINPLQSEPEILRSRSLADTVAGILIAQKYVHAARQVPIRLVQVGQNESRRVAMKRAIDRMKKDVLSWERAEQCAKRIYRSFLSLT